MSFAICFFQGSAHVFVYGKKGHLKFLGGMLWFLKQLSVHSVICSEALLRHQLILCARHSVVGVGIDADATAGSKQADDLDVFGIHQANEVFKDDVDTVFVEVAMVAEAEQIEFQTLAFHHSFGRNISDSDLGKVGLTRDGAQGGELRTVEPHPIVILGMFVLKGF